MSSESATARSASITFSLSLTLEPPRMATNGRFGCDRSPQHLDLPGQQPARGRGQELRGADDGGVGPVRGAEGVVDVGVEALDQPGHEGRVVRLLARVVAEVLRQLDPGASSASRATGATEYLGSGRPLGREMGARHHLGALAAQPLDGGQRSADAQVVGDPAVAQGTLKSARSRTRLPSGGRSSRVGTRLAPLPLVGGTDPLDDVDEATGVASLSYQPNTLTMLPTDWVSLESNVQEAGEPTMSDDTSGASE